MYIDFFVLETNDYDAALGTQLFKMLGLILWDFNSLKNTHLVERTDIVFKGIESSKTALILGKKLAKVNAKGDSLLLI